MICDFTYYSPTKVVFGKGREKETGALIKERGAKKVLVLYGGKSAKKAGFFPVSRIPLNRRVSLMLP